MSMLHFHNSISVKQVLFLWLALCMLPGMAQATGSYGATKYNKHYSKYQSDKYQDKRRYRNDYKKHHDKADDNICDISLTIPLLIDNKTQVGTVKVSYDKYRFNIQYQVNDGWLIENTHLAVSDSFAGIPQDRYGNPKLRRFPHQTSHNKPVTTVNHMLSSKRWSVGTELYIAAHADVVAVKSAEHSKSRYKAMSWSYKSEKSKYSNKQLRGTKSCKRTDTHSHKQQSHISSYSSWAKGYDFPGHKTGYYFTFTLTGCEPELESVIQFEKPVYNTSEANETGHITVIRTGDLTKTAIINISSMNGSAEDGLDYIGINQALVFNPGESVITVSVPVIDDGDDEEIETVNLLLSQVQDATIGDQSSAVLEIVDNDEPLPQLDSVFFEPANYAFRESAGLVQLTVKRTGNLAGEVLIEYLAIGGNAGNADYVLMPGTLVFADGVDTATIELRILEDRALEGNETILIGLNFPVNADIISPSIAEVIIEDNEGGN